MLVLQTCTDFLQVMAGSSTETFPTSSDGNIKVEEHIDIKEEEVNVKTEKGISSEEEKCIDIKHDDCIYREKEKEEEVIDVQEAEDLEIKKEVS